MAEGEDGKETGFLSLPAELPSLEKFRDFVLRNAENAGVGEPWLSRLDLALEELLVNVIRYGYSEAGGTVDVSCKAVGGRFRIEIHDRGKAFDPLAREDPDLGLAIEDRQIGGLGIFLVKQVFDERSYARLDGQNILTLAFGIPAQ